jgi:hypothetical protein
VGRRRSCLRRRFNGASTARGLLGRGWGLRCRDGCCRRRGSEAAIARERGGVWWFVVVVVVVIVMAMRRAAPGRLLSCCRNQNQIPISLASSPPGVAGVEGADKSELLPLESFMLEIASRVYHGQDAPNGHNSYDGDSDGGSAASEVWMDGVKDTGGSEVSENRHGTGPLYICLLAPLCLPANLPACLPACLPAMALAASIRRVSHLRPIQILASLISLLPRGRIGHDGPRKVWNARNARNASKPLSMVRTTCTQRRSVQASKGVRWIATTHLSPYHRPF